MTGSTKAGTAFPDHPIGQTPIADLTNRKLIYIGECELARIVGIANNVLTISTDLTSPTKGLRYAYPAGAPVEMIKVYSYSIDNSFPSSEYPNCLRRTDMANTSTYWFEEIVTAGIDLLRVRQSGNSMDIVLRGRSMKTDPSHTDPDFGDQYHRLSVSNKVYLRNM